MADYIGITEAQSNPFAPLTAELVKQLRDNPIAITEGAPDAPRLYLRSLERLLPGPSIRSRRDETVSVTGSNEAGASSTVGAFEFMQFGTIRMAAEITSSFFGASMTFLRRRNGSTTTLATYTTVGVHTLDVAVLPGDRLWMFLEADASPTSSITGTNFRFQTDGQDLWPGSSFRLEGNRAP